MSENSEENEKYQDHELDSSSDLVLPVGALPVDKLPSTFPSGVILPATGTFNPIIIPHDYWDVRDKEDKEECDDKTCDYCRLRESNHEQA